MNTVQAFCNIFSLELEPEVAHDGIGTVNAVRILPNSDVAGACDFVDYVELPKGTSIGDHRHGPHEEEYYLILAGTGMLRLEHETFAVSTGDLARNPPGGLHGLRNTGDAVLKLFVFQIPVLQGGS